MRFPLFAVQALEKAAMSDCIEDAWSLAFVSGQLALERRAADDNV